MKRGRKKYNIEQLIIPVKKAVNIDIITSLKSLNPFYKIKNEPAMIDVSSQVVSNAVKHTTDVWHTILHNTKMTERKWTMQALI